MPSFDPDPFTYLRRQAFARGTYSGGPPPLVLSPLTLSGTLTAGSASSGNILGATVGSTISTTGVTGFSVNSGARTYAITTGGVAGSYPTGLTETLAGYSNSPLNSSVTVASAVTTVFDPANKASNATISNAGLTITAPAANGAYPGASTTGSKTTGKWEIAFAVNWNGNVGGSTNVFIGVCLASQALTSGLLRPGQDSSTGLVMNANNFGGSPGGGAGNDLYQNTAYAGASFTGFTSNADNRLLLDMSAKTVQVKVNGVLQGATIDISSWASGAVTFFSLMNDSNIVTINPSPSGLTAGYSAWG